MQLSHAPWTISARFDEANLVSCAGLVPAAAMAARAGMPRLLERLSVPSPNAASKLGAVVLGMVAGADSIPDLDLLRHGGMAGVFTGVRAPSTLGTFLRSFTFGHVRQLDAVSARLLATLSGWAPLVPGADQIAYLDLDDTVRPPRMALSDTRRMSQNVSGGHVPDPVFEARVRRRQRRDGYLLAAALVPVCGQQAVRAVRDRNGWGVAAAAMPVAAGIARTEFLARQMPARRRAAGEVARERRAVFHAARARRRPSGSGRRDQRSARSVPAADRRQRPGAPRWTALARAPRTRSGRRPVLDLT